eukprot:964048-Pleurochrysis_carterae.AAC.1
MSTRCTGYHSLLAEGLWRSPHDSGTRATTCRALRQSPHRESRRGPNGCAAVCVCAAGCVCAA